MPDQPPSSFDLFPDQPEDVPPVAVTNLGPASLPSLESSIREPPRPATELPSVLDADEPAEAEASPAKASPAGRLFHAEPDWKRGWGELPDYQHQDLRPQQTVLVHLRSEADRLALATLLDQQITSSTKSIWFPKAEIGKAANKRYVVADKSLHVPRYPVYIISKGRADSRLTARALEYCGIPYRIVVEPQEREAYAAVIDSAKVLALPQGNLGLGSIPARNFVWEHALASGAARHWILDDNISGFCRFHDNLKVEVDSGILFRAVESFVDRYENVAMAGFNYDYFAPRKQGVKVHGVSFNTRIYSGILLDNSLTHRWRGHYNEDTDLSLRILKDGWTAERAAAGEGGRYATALFNAFLMYKAPTLTMKGGNATELYQGVNATADAWTAHAAECSTCASCLDGYAEIVPCDQGKAILSKDGRWLMAESLRDQHPDCTTVERKWGRWQHQVDYRRFRVNRLIEKAGHVAEEIDWSMTLVQDAAFEETTRRSKGTQVPVRERRVQPREVVAVAGASAFAFLGAEPEVTVAPEPEAPAHPEVLLTSPAFHPPAPRLASVVVGQSLADFLGTAPRRVEDDWRPDEIPNTIPVDDLAVNFETDGLDVHGDSMPISVALCSLDGQFKRFLPWGFQGGNLPREQVIDFLKRELRGKEILGANTKFDVHMGRKIGVDFEGQGNIVGDVQLWAALLDPDRRQVRLDKLIEDFLGETGPPRVDESRMADYHASEVAVRALYQVEAPARLRDALWIPMEKEGLHRVRQVEDDCIYPVVETEKNGVKMDEELLYRMHDDCIAIHNKLIMEVCQEAGFAVNLPTDWGRLFEKCGLRNNSKSYAENVVGIIDHPLIKKAHLAMQYISLDSKTFSAYKKLIGPDGVLHFEINQLRNDDGGTRSGRFSIGYVHQVPKHDSHHSVFSTGDPDNCDGTCSLFPRRLFISESGEMLEADAMQVEFRFLAIEAKNPTMDAGYQADPLMSFHKQMWAMLKTYKSDMLYSATKSFDFAKQYGAGSIKLAVMMEFITAEEGEEIRRAKRWNDPRLKTIKEIETAYKRAMPEGDQLLDYYAHIAKPQCDDYCRQDDLNHRKKVPHQGYVETILGRRSRFPNGHKSYIGWNRRTQGNAADLLKIKMIELHRERKNTGFLMRLTVHDSFLGDAQTPETLERVKEILNHQSIPLRIPLLWDCGVGRTWAECK